MMVGEDDWDGEAKLATGVVSGFVSHLGELSNNELKNVLLVLLAGDGGTSPGLVLIGEDRDNLMVGSLLGEEESVVSVAMLSSLSPLVSSLSSFLNLVLTLISNSRPLSGLSGSSDTFVMLLASLSKTALSLFLLLSFPGKSGSKC